jgi:glycine betaine/choline ABC-type transport system substrate-binding protein/lipoprotein-anchoring transpeptidase ErfK/SrfK
MRHVIGAAVAAVVLTAVPAASAAPRVVLADKGFTESAIVTQAYGLALEANGYDVAYRRAATSAIADAALRKGAIDLYPEYTGTALLTLLNEAPDRSLGRVLQKLRAHYTPEGVVVTAPTPFDDGNRVACRPSTVKRLHLTSLSALRRVPRQIVYAANQEHLLRPDGLVVLAREYGALFRGIEVTPINDRYGPIRRKTAQCVYAFATDPELQQLKLTVLKDPKGAFAGTPFRGFVALRKAVSDANPGLRATLDRVSAQLTTARVRALNSQVTLLHRNARKVAAAFLADRGIVTAAFAKTVLPVHPAVVADQASDGAPPVGASARSVRVFFIAGEGRVVARRRALRAGLSAEGGVKVTIRALLKGPTKAEKTKLALRTTIPKAVRLTSLRVRGGIATITLTPNFLNGNDATEIVARVAQIVRTADQFTFVTSVRLSVGAAAGATWNQDTPDAPGTVVTPTNGGLTVSSAGIRAVQQTLAKLHYLPPNAVSGKNDYRTQQAVMAFQAWHGLERDGLVGPKTRGELATATLPRPTTAVGKRIEIYRQKGVVLLIDKGKVVRVVHTSTGKPGFTTPGGTFSIYRKSLRDWSYPFEVWLPFASYFTGGYAFHEYADVPAFPASHGCARIPAPEAPVVYAFATIGTTVNVY